eukprot:5786493-Amphidinium_carterae.1
MFFAIPVVPFPGLQVLYRQEQLLSERLAAALEGKKRDINGNGRATTTAPTQRLCKGGVAQGTPNSEC